MTHKVGGVPQQGSTSIPIMFKVYEGGRFSEGMAKGPVTKLLLSESKGEGLQLAHTAPGKVILVAGGTGLFPFSDFIDLLYKEQLILQRPALREQILGLSPVLGTDPFRPFTFELLAAFQHVDDVHLITLEQLLFLAEVGRLKITFKFKTSPQGKVAEGGNVAFTEKGFHTLLEEKLRARDVSRIWICGPPGMNIMVSKFLRENYSKPDLYLIV
jgi:NAD(P)H-flavin reductase